MYKIKINMKDKSMPLASNNHKKSTHISVLTKHLHFIELKVSKITNTIMQRKNHIHPAHRASQSSIRNFGMYACGWDWWKSPRSVNKTFNWGLTNDMKYLHIRSSFLLLKQQSLIIWRSYISLNFPWFTTWLYIFVGSSLTLDKKLFSLLSPVQEGILVNKNCHFYFSVFHNIYMIFMDREHNRAITTDKITWTIESSLSPHKKNNYEKFSHRLSTFSWISLIVFPPILFTCTRGKVNLNKVDNTLIMKSSCPSKNKMVIACIWAVSIYHYILVNHVMRLDASNRIHVR